MIQYNFQPKKYLKNKNFQTVYSTFFPPEKKVDETYYLENILLDISSSPGDLLWLEHSPPLAQYKDYAVSYNGYYLVMMHGMEGDTKSAYMVGLANKALENGFGVIRVNLRNSGSGLGFSKLNYNAGQSQDLEDVLQFTHKTFSKNIITAGFSLSANLVLKYFGEKRKHLAKYFSAVSAPIDLLQSCGFIDDSKNRFYRNMFISSLKKKFWTDLYQFRLASTPI